MYLLAFRYFNGGPPDPIDYGHDVSITIFNAGLRSAVGNVSGCRSRGREFDPGLVPYFCGD